MPGIIGSTMSESREQLLAWKAESWCWVEETDTGDTFWWPFCILEGCVNRAATQLNSPRCYPHTLPGVPLPDEADEPETVTV
jgi:hypothetical protein